MSSILNIFLLYLLFNITVGFCLCMYYLFKEKKVVNTKEFAMLFFFPAIGLGNWLFNKEQRESIETNRTKNWHIYKNMLQLNWLFIFVMIGYEIYAGFALYNFFRHYEDMKDTSSEVIGVFTADILYKMFGWMMDISVYIILIFLLIVLLLSLLIMSLLFILFPKIKLSDAENEMKILQRKNIASK